MQEEFENTQVSIYGDDKAHALDVVLLHAVYAKFAFERIAANDVIYMFCADNDSLAQRLVESMAAPRADAKV